MTDKATAVRINWDGPIMAAGFRRPYTPEEKIELSKALADFSANRVCIVPEGAYIERLSAGGNRALTEAPGFIATYPNHFTEAQRDELVEALNTLAAGGTPIVPYGATIQVVE